jgi:hypothetical protein
MSKIRFIGLDVHADTIAVAAAEPEGEVRPPGVIPNRLESIRRTESGYPTIKCNAVKEFMSTRKSNP